MLDVWLGEVGDRLVLACVRVTAVAALASFALAFGATEPAPVAAPGPMVEEEAGTVGFLALPVEVAPAPAPDAAPVDATAPPATTSDDGGAPTTETGPSGAEPPVASPEASADPATASGKGAGHGRASRERRCDEPADPAIVQQGRYAWEIDRSVVQRYTRHLGRLDDLGWSARHEGPDGKPDGMRIGGVKCGSDLWDAGIRPGDVVHAVNGHPIHGVPQAFLAYGALRGDRAFEVEITRGGRRRTLTYRLVG